ncbi:Ribonuclease H-like domain, partial [Cinara cedri]
TCKYIKRKPSDEEINTGFITESKQFLHSSNFNDFYNNVKETIQSREDAFIAKGSGWIFNNVIDMNINMCKYNPLRGASYIKLPKIISVKKTIKNIKNKDNKCFLWSIIAALHPQDKNSERISKNKEWENEFDEKSLTDHEEYCKTNKCAKAILPNISDRILQFEKYNHSYKVPFVIYADFESMLPKIDTCQPCDIASYTKKYQKHLPVSFCFNVKYSNISKNNLVTYTGEDAAKVFYEKINDAAIYIAKNYLDFKELSKHFPEKLDLVKGKLAYPYEYMDSTEKYEEESLPNIDKFYSSLTGEHVKQNAYENAKKIWETFEIKNMKDFTILYDKIDVLLLTDIMENYRHVSLKHFKLDPVHYYTTPGFAWNAMLRKTGIELELITDIDIYLMFEQGIRGGLS